MGKAKNTGRMWFWLRFAVVIGLLGFAIAALLGPTIIGYFNSLSRVQKLGVLAIFLVLVIPFFPYIKKRLTAIFTKKPKPDRLDDLGKGPSYIHYDGSLGDFEKEDLFERVDFVNKLCAHISKYQYSKSLVIGLYGGWGEGKTSVIDAVQKKFSADEKYVVFEFNPWHYATIDSISKAFFSDLKTKLESELGFGFGWNTLGDYCQSLEFGAMGFKLGLWPHFRTTEEILQDINIKLRQTNKKLLIIIDDIDRLSPKQTKHVFELVRHSASFEDTIYLLAFDPVTVRNVLPSPDFIEKIVQIGIELPECEPHVIKRYILEFINTLPRECMQQYPNQLIEEMFDISISKTIHTMRQAKRYLNNLSFALPMVYHEVNLIDFMVLEVIREYYPEVYNDIWTSRNHYIGFDIISGDERKRTDEMKRQYIADLFKKQNNDETVSRVLMLLGLIFSKFDKFVPGLICHSAGGRQRVSDANYTGRYFYLHVPYGELPDKKVDEIIGRWNNNDGESITSDLVDYSNALGPLCISMNRHVHEISRELYPVLAKALCSMSLSTCTDKKAAYRGMAVLFASLESRASVLMDCIDCSQDVEFLSVIVEEQCNHVNQIKANEISTKYFDFMKRRYVDSERDIFQELEIASPNPLRLWFITATTQTEESRNILMEYVVASIANSEPKLECCINALRQTGYSVGDQKSHFAFNGLLDTARGLLPSATGEGKELIRNFISTHS